MEDLPEFNNEELAKIALAFEYFTSKEVVVDQKDGTSIAGALTGLEEVKIFMIKLAEMYDLQGEIKTIFSCLLVDELIKFTMTELLVYMEFMHVEVPLEMIDKQDIFSVAVFIHNYHVRRLQRYRVQKYITHLFFDTPENREVLRPQVLHMLEDETADLIMEGNHNLTPDEILQRGPNFYFVRVGELTKDIVMSRYDFSELLHLYMVVTRPDTEGIDSRIITNQTTLEELALYVVERWHDLKLDPRAWVTVDGPMFPLLYENNEDPVSINQDETFNAARILMACEAEGISTYRKPFNLLQDEYAMAQLTPAFCGSHGDHRDRYSTCLYDETSDKTHIEDLDEDDVVYYGLRDGTSTMVVYKIEELYHTFKTPSTDMEGGTGYCFDPWSISNNGTEFIHWKTFPLHTIQRLMRQVLPFKRNCLWSKPLINVCQTILQKRSDAPNGAIIQENAFMDIKLLYQKEPGKILNVLLTMFNSGTQLMRFEEEFDSFDEDALSRLMTGDPWKLIPEPRHTGRPQAETRNLILNVVKAIMELGDSAYTFNRLYITKYYDNSFHFEYDNDSYEIGNYIKLMFETVKMSLRTSIMISGGWLISTASYYHYKLTGNWLNEVQLEIIM
jgi:hypothetical protein